MVVRRRLRLLAFVGALVGFSGVAAAHGGGLGNAQPERLAVPTWLFLSTGGGVIGASFLLASFVTDRRFIDRLNAWAVPLPSVGTTLRRTGRLVGVAGLFVVVLVGLFGPRVAIQNAAILLVWAGWWAGYTMTVYLVGDSWPAVDPFRTLAAPLGDGWLTYPEWLGGWPRVAGLLGIIWLEVVSPLADDPRFLAVTTCLYLGVTLLGSFLVGTETWLTRVDPVAGVFRQYGKVAPIQRRDGSLALTLPGSELARDAADDRSEVALVVALVWGTTYDGFVTTPLWAGFATAAVDAGVPAAVLYPAVLFVGFGVFLAVYRAASRGVRRVAPTYLDAATVARVFAPSLLAIAAGYHLAHYLSYFLTLSPALVSALASPFDPPAAMVLTLPGWVGGLSVAFVLLGHLLAIWVAHGVAYEQFPSKLQAIRSQYPITLVMVGYTMVSLWIVTRPFVAPPHL